MSKRFYLSTRKDRSKQAIALLEALKSKGWERTLDWAEQNAGSERYAETALAEIEAVREADVLVVLLPGGLDEPYPCIACVPL